MSFCTESIALYCQTWFAYALVGVIILTIFIALAIQNSMIKAQKDAAENEKENLIWLRMHGVKDRSRRAVYRDYYGITDRNPANIDHVNWDEGEITFSVQIKGLWHTFSKGVGNITRKTENCENPSVQFVFNEEYLDEEFASHFNLISDAVAYNDIRDLLYGRGVIIFLSEEANRNLPKKKTAL